MNIILCGYNWIGCYALEHFLGDSSNNVFVYTHESSNQDVDMVDLCKKLNVNFSTKNINESDLPFIPDLICSAYYRYIINQNIIDKVNGKIFNIHPSLLPDYKGCSSLTWALINGEKKVGFTYHYIDAAVDTGNIILQKELKVEEWDSQETLYLRVMFEASKHFKESVDRVLNGDLGKIQDDLGRYYNRGCPHDGIIDDNWGEEKIRRFIRAMNYAPRPGAKIDKYEVFKFDEYTLKKNK